MQFAEEIISVLTSDPNANVKAVLEVSAEFPDGVTDTVKRAGSENARRLVWRALIGSNRSGAWLAQDLTDGNFKSLLIRISYHSICICAMIRSFRCRETEKVWQGQSSRKFPGDVQNRALRRLRQVDASLTLEDLKRPPGNRLELLKGNRKGQFSIRVNEQWRICFRWVDGDAFDVEIVDYH